MEELMMMFNRSWILLALLMAATAAAQAEPEEWLVRVQLDNYKAEMPKLAAMQLDIAGVDLDAGTVDIVANGVEMDGLMGAGYAPQLLLDSVIAIDAAYLDALEIETLLQTYAATYPSICQLSVLADGWNGNEVYCLKISDNVADDEDEPELLFNSQIHAREVMTPEITMDMIQILLTGYGTDPLATNLVNNYETWVIPIMNPDGVIYCWNSYNMWRKNRRNNGSSYGVDLNRNYPYAWGSCSGSSGSPSDDTYRGPSAGSEPETQGVLDFLQQRHFIFNISYHSYSEIVIYPYGCNGVYAPEHDIISSVGAGLANTLVRDTGSGTYAPGTAWELLYSVDGADTDYMYHNCGVIPFVIEVNSSTQGFQPSYNTWRNSTVTRNRPGWQYLYNRVNGPSVWGHVYDACTGAPLSAVNMETQEYPLQTETVRTSDGHGRYHYILIPGDYHLDFTKVGYYAQTREVSVGSSAVEMNVYMVPTNSFGVGVGMVTIGDLAGDGDGVIDPGETVTLEMTAAALGGAVTGVTGALTVSDPYVTLNHGNLTFGSIPGGGQTPCQAPCPEITVSSQCPEGHMIEFSVTFDADQTLCQDEDTFSKLVSTYVYTCPVIEQPFDANPAWVIENSGSGGWAFGAPSSGPGSAYTGANVYATNLSGDYGNNGTFRLTSTPFDCSMIQDAELHFYRFLQVESGWDEASILVSADGTNWTAVWSGYGSDTGWNELRYDISSVADGQPAVYIRFLLETDSNTTFDGFYIDDVGICGRTTNAPNVSAALTNVDDSAGACYDGDAYLDAGEEGMIELTFTNRGTSVARSVIVQVTDDSDHISVVNGALELGDIPSGAAVSTEIHVIASSGVTCAEAVTFSLEITGEEYASMDDVSLVLDQDISDEPFTMTLDLETEPEGWTLNSWTRSMARNHTSGGAYSWFSGAANSMCSRLESPELTLPTGMSHALTFWTVYATESGYDGGIVQVNTGSGWTKVTPSPAYPGSTGSTTSCIGSSQTCFIGTNLTWAQYTVDLAAYAGQTLRIGFLFGTDGSVLQEGWYLDDIVITNVSMPHISCDAYPCEGGPTWTPGPTRTPTWTPTGAPTATRTPTPTPSGAPTLTPTRTPTITVAPTWTPTFTPTIEPPTATPIPTDTPVEPTATPTVEPPTATPTVEPPTATPTPTGEPTEPPPTATPTATGEPTEPPPTATPTPRPTDEPPTATPTPEEPSATPLPSATATPVEDALGIDLELSAEYLRAGAQFLLTATLYNIGGPTINAQEWIILDVFGDYWFWPTWRQDADFITRSLSSGVVYEDETILDFIWPDVEGSITGIMFWGALVDPAQVQILGDYDVISFGYGP